MTDLTDSMAVTTAPSLLTRLTWFIRNIPAAARGWIVQRLLDAVVRLQSDRSNVLAHAEYELRLLGMNDGDTINAAMARDVRQLLAVFSAQGHSGFSAGYCTSLVEKLMRFQPITPLTGADEEWHEVGSGAFQNRRCSHVFKQADRFEGQAYDIEARIFREPSGACYTSGESWQPVTFPYTPKPEYVDVLGSER